MRAYVIRAGDGNLLLWTISTSPKRSTETYERFSSQCWEYVRDRQGYEVIEITVTPAANHSQP